MTQKNRDQQTTGRDIPTGVHQQRKNGTIQTNMEPSIDIDSGSDTEIDGRAEREAYKGRFSKTRLHNRRKKADMAR